MNDDEFLSVLAGTIADLKAAEGDGPDDQVAAEAARRHLERVLENEMALKEDLHDEVRRLEGLLDGFKAGAEAALTSALGRIAATEADLVSQAVTLEARTTERDWLQDENERFRVDLNEMTRLRGDAQREQDRLDEAIRRHYDDTAYLIGKGLPARLADFMLYRDVGLPELQPHDKVSGRVFTVLLDGVLDAARTLLADDENRGFWTDHHQQLKAVIETFDEAINE